MEARRWEDLNTDCLVEVFEKVGMKPLIFDVPFVCKSWYKASLIPKCWKNLDFHSLTKSAWVPDPTNLIIFAVTRSCGIATRVVLPEDWGFKDLEYISNQCPAVKALVVPYIQTSLEEVKCVPKLVAKFKELELLRISSVFNLKEIVIEIGTNCKNLRTLVCTGGFVHMEKASSIVTFLPNLRYLGLMGSDLPHDCLIHIINGCKELVYLDVSNCIGFDEDDDEISKLSSHIKTFKSHGSMLYDYYEDDGCNDYEDFTGNGSD